MYESLKVLDLFSGIGGFSLGLERAGMETVAFCEINPFCQRVLMYHWPNVPIYNDVTGLTKERLDADGVTEIDVICGGFPCQDLSVAGKQSGINGGRSGLWSEFARLIGEIRPRFAIVENVPALLSGDGGKWFGRVIGDLAAIGYDAEWNCISASEMGAHHYRNRLWVIAHPNGERFQKRFMRAGVSGQAGRNDYGENAPLGGERFALPCVVRRFHGIPSRVDRIKALGNAVVPQVVEVIGRAIMEAA